MGVRPRDPSRLPAGGSLATGEAGLEARARQPLQVRVDLLREGRSAAGGRRSMGPFNPTGKGGGEFADTSLFSVHMAKMGNAKMRKSDQKVGGFLLMMIPGQCT